MTVTVTGTLNGAPFTATMDTLISVIVTTPVPVPPVPVPPVPVPPVPVPPVPVPPVPVPPVPPVPPVAGVVLRDFSTGDFSQWPASECFNAARQQKIVTSNPSPRKGFKYSAVFEVEQGDLTSGDPTRNRSEVADYASVAGLFGGTNWTAWSMWVENFWIDTNAESQDGNGWGIFGQWHGAADLPLVIGMTKPANHIPHLTVSTMDKGTSPGGGSWDLGVLPQGQWVDLVAGVTWSNAAGHLIFYMNGVKVIDAACCTLEKGANGIVYPKLGIYRARSVRPQWVAYTGYRFGPTLASVLLPPQ